LDTIEPDDIPGRIGRPYETAHEPAGEVHIHLDGDHAEILYVAADPFPPTDFWAGGARGRLADPAEADSRLALSLRVTEEGAELAVGPPTAGGKVLLPPESFVSAYAEGRAGGGDLLAWGRRQVAAYDAWRRGEVYGVVRESLSLSRGSSGLPDVQANWAVLDFAGAEDLLRETAERRASELGQSGAPRL